MTTEVSTGERPARQRETLADTFVVDADVHVHEDPAELAEYAESPWDVGLREIATVEERYLDLPGMSPRAEYRVPFPGGSNRRQIVTSAREMRQGLDELHVDQAVLFPDHLLALAMVRDPAFATTLARAYNRWLHERWLTEERSLKGALVVAPQNPEAGARDILAHGGGREFACVYLPASGLKTLYGDERYDPVYAAASEAGLPVVIHSVEAVYPVFPFQLEQFRTSMAVHALAHPLSMVANLVSMIETGVPVRYQELKIGFMEAGTAWVPSSPTVSTRSTSSAGVRCRCCRNGRVPRCAAFTTGPSRSRSPSAAPTWCRCSSCSTARTARCSPPTGPTTTSTTPSTCSGCRSRPRRAAGSWASTRPSSSGSTSRIATPRVTVH